MNWLFLFFTLLDGQIALPVCLELYFFFFNYHNIHAYKQIDIYELIKIKKTGPNAFKDRKSVV